MKILIVNPPGPAGFTANRDFMGGYGMLHFAGGTVLPPHSLLLLAAHLREAHEVRFVDCVASGDDDAALVARAADFKPDVLFVNTSTPTAERDLSAGTRLKRDTGAALVFVGPHAAHTADEVFATSCADAVLLNNLPEAADGVLSALGDGDGNVSAPPAGALIRRGGGISGKPIDLKSYPLDRLPVPAWDLADIGRYFYLYRTEYPYATMHSSVGCVYRCRFCPYPAGAWFSYAEMSAQRVVSEMRRLRERFGVRMILFRDALFTANRARALEICGALAKDNADLVWRCETSLNNVDPELLSAMARAGCRGINFGIESVAEAVSRDMECDSKRKDIAKAFDVFRECRALGIETFAFFVNGLPNDTRETIGMNAEFAVRLEPSHVQFTFATPYPGTELYRVAVEEGLLERRDWRYFSSLEPVMRTRHLPLNEVFTFNKRAYARFFLRPGRVARELLHPGRLVRRALTFLKWGG